MGCVANISKISSFGYISSISLLEGIEKFKKWLDTKQNA